MVRAKRIFDTEREPNWELIKDSLRCMDDPTKGKAAVNAVMNTIMAFGYDFRDSLRAVLPLIPPNFNIRSIPEKWLTIEEGDLAGVDLSGVTGFSSLLNSLPDDQRDKVMDQLLDKYLYVVGALVHYAKKGVKPKIYMTAFGDNDPQWIANFEVKDLEKPVADKYNFHGQNTSQWLFAGCILVQDGDVSIHT